MHLLKRSSLGVCVQAVVNSKQRARFHFIACLNSSRVLVHLGVGNLLARKEDWLSCKISASEWHQKN